MRACAHRYTIRIEGRRELSSDNYSRLATKARAHRHLPAHDDDVPGQHMLSLSRLLIRHIPDSYMTLESIKSADRLFIRK